MTSDEVDSTCKADPPAWALKMAVYGYERRKFMRCASGDRHVECVVALCGAPAMIYAAEAVWLQT